MLDAVNLNVIAEDRVDNVVEPVGVHNLRVQGHLHALWAFGLKITTVQCYAIGASDKSEVPIFFVAENITYIMEI